MKILVLGGTGAMGVPLVEILGKNLDNEVIVTTRSKKVGTENVVYMQGNAKEKAFLDLLMDIEYDAIIDFLVYNTKELEQRLPIFLSHTKQYFFFSSSRCYAESTEPIKEDSARLVDVCTDELYLATDEYGLAKGRQENLLRSYKKNNWTIIRPYITYNSYRLQLGVYEKEHWLKRALEGRTIVFPKDIAERKTSLTYGPDVAKVVAELIGKEEAFGETFHITTDKVFTWGEILEFYCNAIEKKTGRRPKVKLVEDSRELQKIWNPWQIKYDRLYDRVFDNSKVESIQGKCDYKPTFEGLDESLNYFLDAPKWLDVNWSFEGWCDRQTKEFTPLNTIPGIKTKMRYLKRRFWR